MLSWVVRRWKSVTVSVVLAVVMVVLTAFDTWSSCGRTDILEDVRDSLADSETTLPDAIRDGDLVITDVSDDVYVVKIVGDKRFKRLILNEDIIEDYGHLRRGRVEKVDPEILDDFITSTLAKLPSNPRVYHLRETGPDTGTKHWLDVTAKQFEDAGFDWDSVFVINDQEFERWDDGRTYGIDDLNLVPQ